MRGAWIEIPNRLPKALDLWSLPVRGAWIEMKMSITLSIVTIGRSPCGERGLKCTAVEECAQVGESLPVRGAWIEMSAEYNPTGTA